MKMLNHKGTVTLQTERLLLRPFSTADAQAMYDNWATDPEVTKFLTWECHRSVQDTLAFLSSLDYNKPDVYQWAIVYQGVVIGSISITEIDENARIGAFGYCIGRSFWRQGIMSEAVACVIDYCFKELQFDFLCCGYFLENSRSKRVNEKMGFTFYKNVIHRTRYGVDKKTALNVLYNNSE